MGIKLPTPYLHCVFRHFKVKHPPPNVTNGAYSNQNISPTSLYHIQTYKFKKKTDYLYQYDETKPPLRGGRRRRRPGERSRRISPAARPHIKWFLMPLFPFCIRENECVQSPFRQRRC